MKSLVSSSTLSRRLILVPAALMMCLAFSATSQEDAEPEAAPAQTASADVERGRYLVEKVAMCGQCHTPRNARLEVKQEEWLHGASVPVSKPNGFPKTWAYKAPRIAGLPQHTDEEFVVFLTTGVNRDGQEALSPMPPYRMSEADALAIATYLRSLP